MKGRDLFEGDLVVVDVGERQRQQDHQEQQAQHHRRSKEKNKYYHSRDMRRGSLRQKIAKTQDDNYYLLNLNETEGEGEALGRKGL